MEPTINDSKNDDDHIDIRNDDDDDDDPTTEEVVIETAGATVATQQGILEGTTRVAGIENIQPAIRQTPSSSSVDADELAAAENAGLLKAG